MIKRTLGARYPQCKVTVSLLWLLVHRGASQSKGRDYFMISGFSCLSPQTTITWGVRLNLTRGREQSLQDESPDQTEPKVHLPLGSSVALSPSPLWQGFTTLRLSSCEVPARLAVPKKSNLAGINVFGGNSPFHNLWKLSINSGITIYW